jgi:hypothetical protein
LLRAACDPSDVPNEISDADVERVGDRFESPQSHALPPAFDAVNVGPIQARALGENHLRHPSFSPQFPDSAADDFVDILQPLQSRRMLLSGILLFSLMTTSRFDPSPVQRDLTRTPDRLGQVQRMEGWKAIAHLLGQSVRTVQRWRVRGLPVYRNPNTGHVWGYSAELLAWRDNPRLTAEPGD